MRSGRFTNPGPTHSTSPATAHPTCTSPARPTLLDQDLIATIESEHGPLPEEVKADPEVLAATLEVVRADLTMVATYRPTRADPLTCPLVILGGTDDEESGALLTAWSRYTTGPCDGVPVAMKKFSTK
ncbi:hypothetical protein AB0L65_35890 [Nonomuraea sp. NPDC052116]|uniref:thioesterase II family protein n=1 Tax=Nonomuraea sp. NPDC052116 TaxID=3155665 RepID=UPI0034172616